MKTLPIEIISEHIMPYCYCPQPPDLLQDIRSFSSDYNIVKMCSLLFLTENEDGNDVTNANNAFIMSFFLNIIHFCNDAKDVREIPTIKLGSILRRHVMKRDNYTMEIYDSIIMTYHLPIQQKQRVIKYLWGLLTPSERTEFINTYYIDKFDFDD